MKLLYGYAVLLTIISGLGGRGFQLKEGRFKLNIRRKFFTQRVVRHQHRLPREAVDAPSLEVFKTRLEEAWAT